MSKSTGTPHTMVARIRIKKAYSRCSDSNRLTCLAPRMGNLGMPSSPSYTLLSAPYSPGTAVGDTSLISQAPRAGCRTCHPPRLCNRGCSQGRGHRSAALTTCDWNTSAPFLGYSTPSPGAQATSKLSGLQLFQCVPFSLMIYRGCILNLSPAGSS